MNMQKYFWDNDLNLMKDLLVEGVWCLLLSILPLSFMINKDLIFIWCIIIQDMSSLQR